MIQSKIGNELYVFSKEPYEITQDTDVDAVYVQEELLAEYRALNPALPLKKINYMLMRRSTPVWYESLITPDSEVEPSELIDPDLSFLNAEYSEVVPYGSFNEGGSHPVDVTWIVSQELQNPHNLEYTFTVEDSNGAAVSLTENLISEDGHLYFTCAGEGNYTVHVSSAATDVYAAGSATLTIVVSEEAAPSEPGDDPEPHKIDPDLHFTQQSYTINLAQGAFDNGQYYDIDLGDITNQYLVNTYGVGISYSVTDDSSIAYDGQIWENSEGHYAYTVGGYGTVTLLVQKDGDLTYSSSYASIQIIIAASESGGGDEPTVLVDPEISINNGNATLYVNWDPTQDGTTTVQVPYTSAVGETMDNMTDNDSIVKSSNWNTANGTYDVELSGHGTVQIEFYYNDGQVQYNNWSFTLTIVSDKLLAGIQYSRAAINAPTEYYYFKDNPSDPWCPCSIEQVNTLYLDNPNSLPLSYSITSTNGATIDTSDGHCILTNSPGDEIAITSSFAGDSTYGATSTSIQLKVADPFDYSVSEMQAINKQWIDYTNRDDAEIEDHLLNDLEFVNSIYLGDGVSISNEDPAQLYRMITRWHAYSADEKLNQQGMIIREFDSRTNEYTFTPMYSICYMVNFIKYIKLVTVPTGYVPIAGIYIENNNNDNIYELVIVADESADANNYTSEDLQALEANTSQGLWYIRPALNQAPTSGGGDEPEPVDYSTIPLTLTTREANNSISYNSSSLIIGGQTIRPTVEYSDDGGTTWQTFASGSTVTLQNIGDSIMLRGTLPSDNLGIGTFSATGEFDASGNAMSMNDGSNFVGATSFTYNMAFKQLFKNCNKIIDASNLILPVTTTLPNCYYEMFSGCTSLTSAPQLPATTLGINCYNSMFYGCTSLTNAPQLPATTLTNGCYSGMFGNCTSLTSAPQLPATTLANECYRYMFTGCTSLTAAPQLPATTLFDGCYQGMFNGCTSLTSAPQLPATTLTNWCYYAMFSGCTSLETAPDLLATILAVNSYREMFKGCTNLSYVKMTATDISADYCLNDFMTNAGTNTAGTFIKAAGVTLPFSLPSGWTVEDAA